MDVTIVGAGAIGGTIGAYLSRADLPVRLVDRDLDHVTAMKATGLTIRSDDQIITVPVDAASPSELRGPVMAALATTLIRTSNQGRGDQHNAEPMGQRGCRRRT